jgi:hypothetical protein
MRNMEREMKWIAEMTNIAWFESEKCYHGSDKTWAWDLYFKRW